MQQNKGVSLTCMILLPVRAVRVAVTGCSFPDGVLSLIVPSANELKDRDVSQ